MCILLKLDYAKFGVSNLFFSKVIKEKPLGGRLDSPLVQEGLIPPWPEMLATIAWIKAVFVTHPVINPYEENFNQV